MGATAPATSVTIFVERRGYHFDIATKAILPTIGPLTSDRRLWQVHVTGRLAWWLWLIVHIMYLVGFRNRLSVLLQWAYAYFTYQRGVRLITHESRLF